MPRMLNAKIVVPGFVTTQSDASLFFVVAAGKGTSAWCNPYGRLGKPVTLRLSSVSLFSSQAG
eukprot:523990-Pyramimonas_sp.AAC.1